MPEKSLDQMDIYWIGGSPCSGKSTLAERLTARYSLTLYHSDTNMFKHTEMADPLKQPILYKLGKMSWNEVWMRPVEIQVDEEFEFYRQEFDFLVQEMMDLPHEKAVLAEGTAWLPELLVQSGIHPQRIIYILPTQEFQIAHYSRRSFIQEILAQCEQPQQAFQNWMERDIQFAKRISQQSQALGMRVVWVDGRAALEENETLVARYFNLANRGAL